MASRKTRLYVVMAGLCGVALVVDRMVPASRVTGPAAALAVPSGTTAVEDTVPLSIPRLPFPRTLRAWDGNEAIRDLFAPPMPLQRQSTSTPGGDGSSENKRGGRPGGGTSRSAFASTHTLNAVMMTGRVRVAVLGEAWVREGETIGGCTLQRISDNRAIFSCYDGAVTLTSGLNESPSRQR